MTLMVVGRASTDMENMNGDYLISSTPKGVATKLLRQGASPVHVQRLLKHEDLSTTMGYLDPDALEIENLVKNL